MNQLIEARDELIETRIASQADKLKTFNLLDLARQTEIVDKSTLDAAVNISKTVREAIKAADDDRINWTKPLNDQIKKINEIFKKRTLTPLYDAKETIDGKIMAYRRAEQDRLRKEEEEKRRIEAEETRKAAAIIDTIAQKVTNEASREAFEMQKRELEAQALELINKPVQVNAASVFKTGAGASFYTRKKGAFRVINFTQLPDNYKMANESALKRAVIDGIKEIPGCEYYETEIAVNK